jgi:hypothetical protein
MKRNVLLILLFLTVSVSAQESNQEATTAATPDLYKHEIGGSYGLFPPIGLTPIFDVYSFSLINLNLKYYYNFNRNNAIGGTLTTLIAPNKKVNSNVGVMLSPQILYKITYLREKIVAIYSSISIGVQIAVGYYVFIAYQVDILGISIGKKHNLIIELGYGTQGIFKLGYNYKFNKKIK